MVADTSYYDLLGVSPTATSAAIRKAYRVAALKHHPDRAGDSAEAVAAFQHLKAVYDVLIEEESRTLYDEQGPKRNLHGEDEEDEEGIAGRARAWFKDHNPICQDDIEAYEDVYRGGVHEKEDLKDFFERFEGNVVNVVDFIPYSDIQDLHRFVRFWQQMIDNGQLQDTELWQKARRMLNKRAKRVKQRDDPVAVDQDDGTRSGEEGCTTTISKKKNKKVKTSIGNAKNDSGGGGGNADGMSDLVALIQKRQQRGKQDFDEWAARIERESKEGRASGRKGREGKGNKNKGKGGNKGQVCVSSSTEASGKDKLRGGVSKGSAKKKR